MFIGGGSYRINFILRGIAAEDLAPKNAELCVGALS
jgi:hypothetical protein